MPRCACPLRGRSGSMCVEAHYLATDAAAGRAEKKRISPGFLKKRRFNEVNCRLNTPRRAIGEAGATRRPGKLAEVKSEVFFSEWIEGSLLFGVVERSQVFPPPICDDKGADGLLKSNTSPQSQRLSTGERRDVEGGLIEFYSISNLGVCFFFSSSPTPFRGLDSM